MARSCMRSPLKWRRRMCWARTVATSPAVARIFWRCCWESGNGICSSLAKFHSSRRVSHSEVVGAAEDGFEHGDGVDPGAADVDEDPGGGWGEEVEDGDVEGPGQGDEVVGGELADPVAGDGALGVGDHGFAPFFAGHAREEPSDVALGQLAAVA